MRHKDQNYYMQHQDDKQPAAPNITWLDIVQSLACLLVVALVMNYGFDPIIEAIGRFLR